MCPAKLLMRLIAPSKLVFVCLTNIEKRQIHEKVYIFLFKKKLWIRAPDVVQIQYTQTM